MESWDDDNFEPPPVVPSLVKSNKWVGEDEEEEIKESWEDEDEEKKEEESESKQVEIKKNKKKILAGKLAEKEAKKKELEQRLREQLEEDISPEERIRMEKESDLKVALETTFGEKDEETEIGGLKLPSTSEEFEEFTETLSKTLTPLSRHGNHFVNFTEGLTRNLCAAMHSSDIRKIKNALDNLYLEKQKIEKGDKSKKNKGKGKAKLKMEGENAQLSAYTDIANDFDEFDDFM